MEQFSLEKYFENPTRKVVTRRGNPVRILCTDRKHGEDDLPIVFLEENNGGEFLLTCRNDGRCDNYDTQYDLFFADEEESMNEFETRIYNLINFSDPDRPSIKEVKEEAEIILELARNELEKKFVLLAKEDYQTAFDLGKAEILKDLPKWKKATEQKDLEKHVAILEEGKVLLSNYLEEGDYYIELEDLKTLLKEE